MKKFRLYLTSCSYNTLLVFAVTTIMFFFSERLFWTILKPADIPDNTAIEVVITLLIYMAPTYVLLALISKYKTENLTSIMIIGCLFGWLVEGGIVHTLYGTQAEAPFPLSIIITGVSWHGLISGLMGLYFLPRALTKQGTFLKHTFLTF